MSSDVAWKEPLTEWASLVAVLDDRARTNGDDRFVTFPFASLTYDDIARRSREIAAGLAELGVTPGDRVAVLMRNQPAFLDLYFAAMRLGALLVPINVSLRGDDLAYTLTDADPVTIIVGPTCIEHYRDISPRVSIPTEFTVNQDADGFRQVTELRLAEDPPAHETSQGDAAVMIYTSGTTGMPKGVVLPHGALLSVGTELSDRIVKPTSDDVLYMSQPLFHIFAQMVVAEGLIAEVPVVLGAWFSKSNFWDSVREHNATMIHFSSAISEILYRETEAADNPVRIALGAIADDRQRPFAEKFDCTVIPLYGLTESGGLALAGTIDDPRTGSLGTPTRYLDVTIVDEDDNPVGPNEHGEIVIHPTRPHCVFQHYYQAPEATLETLRNQWLHTGDIGYIDEAGDFHFVSRKAYFIRRLGENISAFEVERAIEAHPQIAEAVVVGVEEDVIGQEVFTAIRTDPNDSIEPHEVLEFLDGHLAEFKIPRYVTFVDEFPTTETKATVQRFKITEDYLEAAWDREEAGFEFRT